MRAVESVSITLADGVERQLLFTLGAIMRLNKMNRENKADPIDFMCQMIYEGLVEKNLTVEQIADLVDIRMLPDISEIIAEATGRVGTQENPPLAQREN